MRSLFLALAAVLVFAACQPEDDTVLPRTGSGGTVVSTTSNGRSPLILGGTVTAAAGGDLAVVSDPERDLVHIIDVRNVTRRTTVRLPTGSQPTRSVEDRFGAVHVVLRGTGQLATIALSSGTFLRSTSVCPEPRGVTFDRTTDSVLVACASGELVTLPSNGSTSVRRLGADLRDVLVQNGKVKLTTFRSATLLELDKPESAPRVVHLPSLGLPPVRDQAASFEPSVAWRAVPGPNDSVVIVHQRAVQGDIDAIRSGLPPVTVPYYTNSCAGPIVRSVVSVVDSFGVPTGSIEVPGALPVDVAASKDQIAIISAGNSQLIKYQVSDIRGVNGGLCGTPGTTPAPSTDPVSGQRQGDLGHPVGIAYVGEDSLLIHSRSPARVILQPSPSETRFTSIQVIDLEGVNEHENVGSSIFHTSTSAGLACASCHPEGSEDGHVWTFFGNKRRTQPLTGGITKTAPFHWKGDLRDLPALMADTYVSRMGGTLPLVDQMANLGAYLDRLPSPKAPTLDHPVDMAKGEAVFQKAGCDACHGGPMLSVPINADIGTGVFQVPSLRGLARRAPYMHDGCAETLDQRFSDPTCGGSRHGDLSALTTDEQQLLMDYLKQL